MALQFLQLPQISLLLLPLMILFHTCIGVTVRPSLPRIATWADAADRLARATSCEEAPFAGERECRELWHVPRANIAVYAAQTSGQGRRLISRLPDGSLSRSGPHDAVLVLDPFPSASFGHLVLVFFVDFSTREERCHQLKGHYLGNDECLTQAVKNRCRNLMEKRFRRRNLARRCEIQFLPLVHYEDAEEPPFEQQLNCRTDIPGFGPCPELRSKNATSSLVCNPLHENTQRCSTTHETVHTRCRVLETCDQAVILSGGWNREHSPASKGKVVRDVFFMLQDAGFPRNNIKVFYVNGAKSSEVLGEKRPLIYPSAMKLAMRYHLQKLCSSPFCVDSLVVYLNSPTRSDGSMLLWDVDGKGEVDETEVYTIKELLNDLKECRAKRVVVLVDQSFSGEITKAFARSRKHSNVLVFASGQEGDYSWESEFTNHWANYKHTHTCVGKVHEESLNTIRRSNPTMSDGSNGNIRTTIFGAPCDTYTISDKELSDKYFGCQNLPTKLWVTKYNTPADKF